MANKDYSLLNKTLIITDMYETDQDPMVLGGVAIRAKDLEEFIEAVEGLAISRFGGDVYKRQGLPKPSSAPSRFRNLNLFKVSKPRRQYCRHCNIASMDISRCTKP